MVRKAGDMTSLPGIEKNNMAAKYMTSFYFLKLTFINKRWTFLSANKQLS